MGLSLAHEVWPVAGAANDLVALLTQQPDQALPQQQLVLADHDPHPPPRVWAAARLSPI